jgi:hypothetical protein
LPRAGWSTRPPAPTTSPNGNAGWSRPSRCGAGRPLSDVAGLAWFDGHARRLEQLLLQARVSLLDTRLALGRHGQLVVELEELAGAHPLDEHIHGQLMLALYRAGRQGDALAVFRRLRQALGEELGVDPSGRLRDLEAAMLRQDPTLDAAMPRTAVVAAVVPAQLPPATAVFAGRTRELGLLDDLLPVDDRGLGSSPASRSSPVRRGSARPPWRCDGRTGSRPASPTDSSTSTGAASTRAGGRSTRAPPCGASSPRSA